MTRYGYFLSSEEYDPGSLIRQATLAEQAGFEALWISDHFHPWLDEQGESSFVWSVIGAISQVTDLPITTAVTCPTVRIHPAIIAQAAATAGLLTNGKFNLGLGTGEALNEHITGQRWPSAAERREMLEEAIEIIVQLFTGEQLTHHGKHYQVDTARLYSTPAQPPPVYVSGFGGHSARMAAKVADGYICMGPKADLIQIYRDEGGEGPVQGGIKGCWGKDEHSARKTMHRLWPTDSIPGESAQLLPLPRHFEQLSELITEDMIEAPHGPDPDPYLKAIEAYQQAGFDEVYLGQIGGNEEGFFDFASGQLLPRLREG
ncbi:MAG: TIGR03557 family F420-dependent LLM class oxidoreductase [Streptosporangiaceae bacterium]|nr:TIGR03557 family F420-dependent LLM class oxidoreductase [Streptosporangiaceae bacterium]